MPRPPAGNIKRRHLLKFLLDHLNHRLIVISAAAGYGKTSLLISLAEEASSVTCWFSIDSQENELRRFFVYLVGAIRKQIPEFGRGFERFLARSRKGSVATDHLVALLINDLETTLQDRILIVLDDYHHVDSHPEISKAMKQLISRLPAHCTLVIASRSDPDLDIPLYASRRELALLDNEALRLTQDEIRQVFKETRGIRISREDAARVYERTNGWGALVALEAGSRARSDHKRGTLTEREWSKDFLLSEILENQTEEIKRFLIHTSVLDNLTEDDCKDITENEDSSLCLRYLESSNLLSTSYEGPEKWFRYNEVFREFLERQFSSEYPAKYRRVQSKAGLLYQRKGNYKRAFELFVEAKDYDRACDLAESVADALIEAGERETVRQWLDLLPQSMHASNPKIMLLLARIKFICGEPSQAVTNAKRARDLFHKKKDRDGEIKAMIGVAFFHRQMGDWDSCAVVLRDALSVAGKVEDAVTAEVCYHLAIHKNLLGEYQNSIEYYNRARRLFLASRRGEGAAAAAQGLGSVYGKVGAIDQAVECYQQALDYWKGQSNAAMEASILADLATAHRFLGSLGLALEYAQRALAKSRISVTLSTEGWVLMQLGEIYIDLGSYQQASSSLEKSLEIFRQLEYPLEEGLALDLLGNLCRLLGEPLSAIEYFEQGLALAQQHEVQRVEATIFTSKGILYYEEGDLAMAGEYLRQGADKAEVCSDSYTSCRAVYFLVGVELRKRSFHSAAELVARLDAYLSQVQSNHFLKTDAIRNRNILKSIIRRWPTYLHLNKLCRTVLHDVSKLEMRSQAATPGRRSRYPELKIRSFGVAEVVQDSRLILPEDWVWSKAKELFFFLLHSKSPLSSERIVEALWPGRDFREARSNLYSAVHRIRSCLFPEAIISAARTYQINRAANYWWDVKEFETLVTATSQRVSTIEELTKLYERMVNIYAGRFLEELYSEWCHNLAISYEEQYCGAMFELGRKAEQLDQCELAIECCNKILSTDPLREDAVELKMKALVNLGRGPEATRLLNSLERELIEELNIRPSPSLRTIVVESLSR